ncbi:MAG TPA: hypothetical protein VMS11_03260 [Solirubrobacterales bacterium]|nr:hypothetical protein [Solirubrobacterales bacterium]
MSSPLSPLPAGFAATVVALHRVAELVVAPARKPDNEIALTPTPGGFGTPEFEYDGARRQVRVEGTELVQAVGDGQRRAPLTSLAEAGTVVAELLPADADLSDDPLALDADAAAVLADWYEFGGAVLRAFAATAPAGDAATEPILWPEHFDLAIELGDEAAGERATYGFSPGDENHAEPYAYVAPWRSGVEGELWNAVGFGGAELGYEELLGAADPQATATDFFAARRRALAA